VKNGLEQELKKKYEKKKNQQLVLLMRQKSITRRLVNSTLTSSLVIRKVEFTKQKVQRLW
jgi:hypothetical protein